MVNNKTTKFNSVRDLTYENKKRESGEVLYSHGVTQKDLSWFLASEMKSLQCVKESECEDIIQKSFIPSIQNFFSY